MEDEDDGNNWEHLQDGLESQMLPTSQPGLELGFHSSSWCLYLNPGIGKRLIYFLFDCSWRSREVLRPYLGSGERIPLFSDS